MEDVRYKIFHGYRSTDGLCSGVSKIEYYGSVRNFMYKEQRDNIHVKIISCLCVIVF